MARLHRRSSSGAFGLPSPALSLNFIESFTSAMSRLTFTRASSASYFDAAGAMQTATTSVPRFDTNPTTLVPCGFLIEESRTNLLLGSAAPVTQNCTVAATPYTLSFYGTGTVTLSGVSTAGPLVGSGAYPTRSTLTFTPTAGTLTLTVSGTVEYANLEPGSFATSWIPTTGATATRAADVCSALTSSFAFNAAAGTLVSTFTPYALGGSDREVANIGDGTAANFISVFISSASGKVASGAMFTSGANQGRIDAAAAFAANTLTKAAYAWAASDRAISGNGGAPGTSATASIPTVTTLTVGSRPGGTVPYNGWISSLSYYPSRLSNTSLQSLTS